ncbi:MAG: serine/threonine-protein phosphatase [Planctomycetes bacterium]|nr:serine/threonine-protein phosphatase [Planctomycetota bacterium]
MAKKEKSLAERFRELCTTHPSFHVTLDDQKTWVCPYCGTAPGLNLKSKDFMQGAYRHVVANCPPARALEGTIMPAEQLEQVVIFHRLRTRFSSEPTWRLSLGEGKWLCPYCMEETDVRISGAGGAKRETDDIIRDVRGHLDKCFQYMQDASKWHSLDEIKARIRERKQEEAFIQLVVERVKSDPVFQFSDRYGHWMCPFCEKPIAGVDFGSQFAREHTAPKQAAAHFAGGNCRYRGGPLDPGKTAREMQEITKQFLLDAGGEQSSAGPGDTQYLTALRSELSELKSHLEHNKEMQANLQRARKAQQNMLPASPPEAAGYEIAVYFNSSEEVSGDFYDFIDLGGGKHGIVIGDVSGHGLDAGIVMGMTKKAFNLRAQSGQGPLETATRVNEDIFPELGRTTFVTAIYGVLDTAQHTFTFVRCGHTFPVLSRPTAGAPMEVLSEGVVLGSVHGEIFAGKTQVAQLNLDTGETLVLFTDGILEAMRENEDEFGKENILETVGRHGGSPALGVLEGLVGAVHMFTQGHPQNDDQTIIVVRREGRA